jgi:hypothetical protein
MPVLGLPTTTTYPYCIVESALLAMLPCRCTQSTELIKHLFEMSFEAGSLGVGRRNALWSHTHDKIVLKVDPCPITVHLGLGTQDPLFW